MPFADLGIEELHRYAPRLEEPGDFDARWTDTLAEAREFGGGVHWRAVDSYLTAFEVFDVSFPGFGGDPVSAWWVRPRGSKGDLPIVVEFNGYGGGRGLPHERLLWPAVGYAYLFMDTRGQGSAWGNGGSTADASGGGAGAAPSLPGFMTRGVEEFEHYYYRRLLTDAARAVDAARELPGVDATRVALAGASQGGGLAIAAAGLVPDVAAALVDVPFLCHFGRGVELADQDPYQEIVRYLAVHRDKVDAVFATLAYVDGVHHAARARCPALFSAALRDDVCPPSTVFAAYHAWGGPAQIVTYPYNSHEGGQAHQQRRQLEFLADLWS